jgi:hypothetical protein
VPDAILADPRLARIYDLFEADRSDLLREVRDAPDRPWLEYVFLAQRT